MAAGIRFINFQFTITFINNKKGAENHSRLERVQHLNTLNSKQQEKGGIFI